MTPSASARQFRRAEHPATAAQDSEDAREIEARPGRLREQFDEERLDRIMSDLDAAMAGLDEVVRRVGGSRGQTE